MLRTTLLLFVLLMALGIAACQGPPPRQVTTLETLETKGTFEVTITSRDTLISYISGDTCYYSEWAFGERDRKKGWQSITSGYQTEKPFTVVTQYGELDVDIYLVRLYLGPYFSRTYERANAELAPAPIQQALERAEKTLTVFEYMLLPKRTYYAQVGKATYQVPATTPGGASETKNILVLEISDLPFVAGVTKREITPAYQGYVSK